MKDATRDRKTREKTEMKMDDNQYSPLNLKYGFFFFREKRLTD